MRARLPVLLATAALLAAVVSSSASALTFSPVKGFPRRCDPYPPTVASDGALWFQCGLSMRLYRVGTNGKITRLAPLPVDPQQGPNPHRVGFSINRMAASGDGSVWFSSGSGFICHTAGVSVRCARTPEADSIPAAGNMDSFVTGPITVDGAGNAWLVQSQRVSGRSTTVVRVTPDLQLSEFAVPEPLTTWDFNQYPSRLVLGSDGTLWFGTGYSHIGRVSADGTVSFTELDPGIQDRNPVDAAAATPTAVFLTTDDDGRRLVRITPDGHQTIANDVPRTIRGVPQGPIVDGEGAAWVLEQHHAGAGRGHYDANAFVRIDATGARTTHTMSGRVAYDPVRGLGGRIWSIAHGYEEAHWRLVTIDDSFNVLTRRTYAGPARDTRARQPSGSTWPERLVSSDKAMWLFTGTNLRGRPGGYPTGVQLIR